MVSQETKDAILQAQVDAALSGHDIGPFEPVNTWTTGGYDAHCRQCGKSVWVGDSGLHYSLLEDSCPEPPNHAL